MEVIKLLHPKIWIGNIAVLYLFLFSFACSAPPTLAVTETPALTETPMPATVTATRAVTATPTPTFTPEAAFSDQCAVAPSGMVGWWPGNGNAQDMVAGNNGGLKGGVGYVAGIVGKAFSFDGINGSVNIPRTPGLDVGEQVSVEFWMKPAPGNPMHKCCQGLVSTDYYLVEILDWTSSVSGVSIDVNTSNYFTHTAEDPHANYETPVDEWSFLVGTYDGSRLSLYINGKLEAQVLKQGIIIPMEPNSYLSIGSEDGRLTCSGCVGSRYFHGLIDEVSIYNRALTEIEIQSIFLAGEAGKCNMPK